MNLPRLTAESGIGPAVNCYAGAASAGPPAGLWPMQDIGDALSCLISCGVPNVLTTALQCGIDIECWVTKGGSAAVSCVSKCLS